MKKLFAIILAIALGYIFAYFFVGQSKGYKFIPGMDDITDFKSLYENFKEKQKQKELETYNEKFEEAVKYFNDGEYWEAENIFEELYDDYDSPEALYWMGRCEYADGYYYSAIDDFENLVYDIADDGSFDSAYYYLGKAYYQEDEYENAIEAFQNYLNKYPSDVSAMDWYAWAYYMIDEYDSAYVYEQKAIETDPEFTDAYYGLAHFKLYYATHEDLSKNEQKKLLKNVITTDWHTIALDSLYHDAFYDIGKAYYYLKNNDSAAFYFEKYFENDPTDKHTLEYLIDIYSQNKDINALDRIISIADDAAAGDETIDSLIAVAMKFEAQNFLNKKDYESAIETYFACYDKSNNPEYLLDIAEVYVAMNDNESAIEKLSQYLDEASDDDARRQEALELLQKLDGDL